MVRWTRGGMEDRWHGFTRPGAYEWWGFEAYDADRDIAFALRISAGDPMDPTYARLVARPEVTDDGRPDRHVRTRVVVYRHGQRLLARTARPDGADFAASTTSGAVHAGDVRVQVEERPAGRTSVVEVGSGTRLAFCGPAGRAAGTGDLDGSVWDLAPLDLRVTGTLEVPRRGGGIETLEFSGRGVHDHGAGPGTPRPGVRSWAWGWAHAWEFAMAWRQVVLDSGDVHSLLVVDRDGEPFIGEEVRSRRFRPSVSLLGVPHRRRRRLDAASGARLAVERSRTLASSPIGMRFVTNVRLSVDDAGGDIRLVDGMGLSSVARPARARKAPWHWLTRARDVWTAHRI
ncbi:MAG: hypothetical protein ACE5IK_03925 [Acidobacteriota bacterium]